jgi:hypothetical protein
MSLLMRAGRSGAGRGRTGLVVVLAMALAVALLPASDPASTLAASTTLSGTVTDADGNPLQDICVSTWGSGAWALATDANGQYTASISPGTYKIHFSGCEDAYVDEWFDDQPDFDSATPVVIADGQSVEADASLATGGTIAGTITGPGGQPLEGACASARRQQDVFAQSGRTDANGDYVIGGLASGEYRVRFSRCDAGNYIGEYYDDRSDEDSADPVSVTIGQPTVDIDAELAQGAAISGRVVGVSGQPVADVCVHAYATQLESGPGSRTDANGRYAIEGIPGGTYRILFVTCGAGPYGLEWFDNKPDWSSANPVTASVGSITRGIDADFSTKPALPPPPAPAAMPDMVGPDATIVSGPKRKTTRRRPRFAFDSSDPEARFECGLDETDLGPCSSPIKLSRLRYGKHTFSVVAIDTAANRGQTVERRFKVKRKKRR